MSSIDYLVGLLLILSYFKLGKSVTCYGDTFVNLCGYCVGGSSGLSELEGLDRCKVCGGNSSCVGCDGVVNSEYKKDFCGLCLKSGAAEWNDCLVIRDIYPKMVDRALKNNLVAMTVRGAGFHSANPAFTTISCSAVGNEGQKEAPKILDTSVEDEDLELMVEVGSALGLYTVSCAGIEGTAPMRVVNSLEWDTVSVLPSQLRVDLTYELELHVKGDRLGLDPVLCVIRCSASPPQLRTGTWTPLNSVSCHGFTPRFSGWCEVGIAASEDAGYDKDSCGAFVKVSIVTTPPHILNAEYNQDLGKLLIRFDVNIQLSAPCENIFSQASLMSIDASECQTSGDLLAVALRPDHPLLPAVDILKGNGIRRVGTSAPDLSPECYPVAVPVSRQKVLPPNLSLQVPSVMCHNSEELRVSSIGKQRLSYIWSVPPPAMPSGSQRENLQTWRNVRELERGLNTQKNTGFASIHAAELMPGKAYKIQVRGTNVLGDERVVSSALVFSPTAKATVVVSARPAALSLLAEVNLTMCSLPADSLNFQWFLNEKHIPGGGRMMQMGNLKTGIYNISCVVSLYQSRKVVAAGWVLTQVLPSEDKALLSPAKQVVGTMDTAIIHAFLPYGRSAVWRCFTPAPESLPCVAPGPKLKRVDQQVINNFSVLTIQPGLLPVGKYIWRLENIESTEAIVEVRAGVPPLVRITPVPPHVNPRKSLLIHGDGHRLHTDCTLRWTTVFLLGFNYFNLEEDVGLGDPLHIQFEDGDSAELPLVVPTSQGHWGGLMSEASYLLRLLAECPESGQVYADVPIVVNVPPTVAPILVYPSGGIALISAFTVTGGSAFDILGDYPLRFVWSILFGEEEVVSVAVGASARTLSILLPPGEITVTLSVCDIHTTCTAVKSEVMIITSPASVPSSVIDAIKNELTDYIIEGSIIEGIGRSVVALKTLSGIKTDEAENQFKIISEATERAISIRITDLIQEMEVEPLLTVTALDLLQDVFIGIKFLHPDNKVLDSLNQLKDAVTRVTPYRKKREVNKVSVANKNEMPSLVRSCEGVLLSEAQTFPLHAAEENQMDRVLTRVKDCIKNICSAQGNAESSVDTPLVKLWVSRKLDRNSAKRKIIPDTLKNMPSVLFGALPSTAKCLAIAKLDTRLFKSSEFIGFGPVYEIQFATNKELVALKSHDPPIDIYLQKPIGDMKPTCLNWDSKSKTWLPSCTTKLVGDSVVCNCRQTGYIALSKPPSLPTTSTTTKTTTTTTTTTTMTTTTTTSTPTSTPSTTTIPSTTKILSTTTKPTAITSTTVAPSHSPTHLTTTTPLTTRITETNIPIELATASSATIIEPTEFANGVKVESVVREIVTGKSTIGGGRFVIDNDFHAVIEDNLENFQNNLTMQIAQQLGVLDTEIFIVAKEGSIVVSVYFLMDMEPQKALAVLGHLVNLVKNEELSLEHNGKRLNIPKQNLTLIITPEEVNPKVHVLQTATFVVAGSAVAIVILMVILATRGQTPSDFIPRRGSRVEDSSPCYLDLHNDYSLDGSSESLAQFRRPSLWSEK